MVDHYRYTIGYYGVEEEKERNGGREEKKEEEVSNNFFSINIFYFLFQKILYSFNFLINNSLIYI